MSKKYTVIYMASVGRPGNYIAKMRRVRTKDLEAYLNKHELDAVFIFEGWPALEGHQ